MHCFRDLDQLIDVLSKQIAGQLTAAISQNGHALLAVSGGSTPKPLFEKLSKINIAWQHVWVLLVDERWVDTRSADSNECLVRSALLKHCAKTARFMGLKSSQPSAHQAQRACNLALQELPAKIDVLLLGMGDDGHTASMFPCADKKTLFQILDKKNVLRVMAVQPREAPHERMSLTAAYLLTSGHRYLLMKGENKLATFKRALSGEGIMAMPIRVFLHQAGSELEVFYAAQ